MNDEINTFKNYLNNDFNILSIGSGIGGLEVLINSNFKGSKFSFIEKNYISKKVKYGWTGKLNSEAYNNLDIQKEFLILNHMNDKQINIIDFDKDSLPIIKFDIVTSFFSLDYHYDTKT